MIDPAVLRAMQAAGASIDVIIAAVEAEVAIEEQRKAAKRENNAERQRRFKAKRKASVVTQDNAGNALPSVTTPPNDIYSNPPRFDVSDETSAVSSFEDRVTEAWNAGIEGTALPAARKLIGQRLKHLKARVREYGEAAVFVAIANMHSSDFHSGRSGRWLEGNIGWLLKSSENFEKMLERTNAQPPTTPPSNLAILSKQAERYRQHDQAA